MNVLVLTDHPRLIERAREVDPERVEVIDVANEFTEELAREWPGHREELAARPPPQLPATRREEMLREADVVVLGFPFPRTLPRRTPNLRWAHFGFAGVSNLRGSDWWNLAGPVVTSARGATAALPIAETAVAAALMLAKRLDVAARRPDAQVVLHRADYAEMTIIEGKAMAIVGLGGIGRHVARLARGLGMRVMATRRSATARRRDVDGVDELFPPDEQNAMLEQADFVAICAMWTPSTEGMLDAPAFAAMKPGAVLVNVARGELLDEEAMVAALRSGRLRGAYLDVWHGDEGGRGAPPSEALRGAPNVVITPHVSGSGDTSDEAGADLFAENLGRLLRGEPLANIVDWSRGY